MMKSTSPMRSDRKRQAIDYPDGLDDQEKTKYDEILRLFKGDSSGFMTTTIAEAVREPEFMQRISSALRKNGIQEASARISQCDASINLDPEVIRTILSLPSDNISILASAAEELHKRQIDVTPAVVKEIFEQAVVMRVMEAERKARYADQIQDHAEMDDTEERLDSFVRNNRR